MASKLKSDEFPVYMVCFTDENGDVNYLTDIDSQPEIGGSSWSWSREWWCAMLFHRHSKAHGLARHITDPEVGPVWYVRAAVLTLGDKVS